MREMKTGDGMRRNSEKRWIFEKKKQQPAEEQKSNYNPKKRMQKEEREKKTTKMKRSGMGGKKACRQPAEAATVGKLTDVTNSFILRADTCAHEHTACRWNVGTTCIPYKILGKAELWNQGRIWCCHIWNMEVDPKLWKNEIKSKTESKTINPLWAESFKYLET